MKIRGLVFLPMLVFTLTYLLTCLLGAIALLVNLQPFVDLFEYFSGTRPAPLAGDALTVTLVLLFVAPLVMWVGYVIVVLRLGHRMRSRLEPSHPSLPLIVPYAVFGVCATVAIISLIRASSIGSLGAWFDFTAWINARWRTFGVLSFFEFVNIYMFVPFSAAWIALEVSGPGAKRFVLRWAPALIAVALAIPLFQKKAAVVSLIIIACAYVLQAALGGRRLQRVILVGAVTLFTLYFAMVVVPTFNVARGAETLIAQRQPASSPPATSPPATSPPATSPPATSPPAASPPAASPPAASPPAASPTQVAVPKTGQVGSISSLGTSTTQTVVVVVYAFLAPITRTSAPALYYAIIFPKVHPYFGLDLGQDIVCSRKIGCHGLRMPDDNIVVWDYMNPTVNGGTVAAPFQFVLYSQVGVAGAVIGSLVVGALLAIAWLWVLRQRGDKVAGPLWATLIILFAIYLAIDSLRNSTTVSYGLIWPAILVAGITVLRLKGQFSTKPTPDAALREQLGSEVPQL